MMDVLICDDVGNFLLIATDGWDGRRKVVEVSDWAKFMRMIKKEMRSDPVFNNYYKYSILKLNRSVRPSPIF